MNRFSTALLLGVSVLGFAAQGHAADLIIDEPAVVAAPEPTSIYVQLLGGVAAPLDATFYGPTITALSLFPIDGEAYPNAMDLGWAAAATLGIVVMDGVSLEADVLHTARSYSDYDADISTTSLMANAKFTAELSDGLSVYAAAGIGAIVATDTYEGFDINYTGFGYQLIGGVAVRIAEQVSLIGEMRYQDSFSGLTSDDSPATLSLPIAAALVGVKIGF